jgi:transcriptional regulator with XRE-family HTH domain
MGIEKELATQPSKTRGASRTKAVREAEPPYEAEGSEQERDALSLFSTTLRALLKNHKEVVSLAATLGVAENTIYRWLKGDSEPRLVYLHRLVQIFPEHFQQLSTAIEQTFPGALERSIASIQEIPKDLYRSVVELLSMTIETEVRWKIMQTIFEAAINQLDSERQGLAVMFAQLMPEREDGIHSLYEVMTSGTPPWLPATESHVYLGSTSLAGMAAMSGHMQNWSILDDDERAQVDVDIYEQSASAHPVTRGSKIAGVLVVSSTQPAFFDDPIVRQSVVEYAQLLGLAFCDDEFKPFPLLNLMPFPSVHWQRAEINRSYINRIVACARQRKMSRREAELLVRQEMEIEFEQYMQTAGSQTGVDEMEQSELSGE